ncbi:MAG TPA: tripartite tricarboxylate transporter substrate binding protein [Burkholderiales bacterium]|nr:tripartite tricarboxylate transporter substrate binding protein [Burkholderiales bacterium]
MKEFVARRTTVSIALSAAFAFLPAAASAQNAPAYPTKPIRFVIANSAGGGLDVTARVTGPTLIKSMGQQVIYDNRGGAAGSVAAETVAKAPPDGYTMLMGSIGNIAVNPHVYKNLAYDPLKDLAPVTFAVSGSNVLVVHPTLPVKNVQDLVALLKAKPGGLTYGSSGSGNAGHLAAELFQSMTKTKMTHVPYKGGAPAMTALLGGEVQLIFASPSTAQVQVTAGKVRALAVTTLKRSLVLPDLPTLAESGLPGYETDNWYGVMVPAKTPKAIVARLNKEFMHALNVPEVKDALLKNGLEARPGTPEEFGKYIRSEYSKWGKVIKEAGIGQS